MDKLTKAVSKDGFLRMYAVVTTDTVRQAQKYHGLSPVATAALGRLLSAGSMMGAMLKTDDASLTLQMKGDGPLKNVVVVANAKGMVKGYVANPDVDIPLNDKGKLDVGGAIGKGTLSVIKDLKMKEPYVGQLELQTGEVGDDLAYYFAQSEQVPSVVALGVLVDRDYTAMCSGGFIIQVMPDCDEKTLTRLENSIQGLMPVTEMLQNGMDGAEIVKYVMLGFEPEILEETEIGYECDCSRERMERALISLGKTELESIIEDQNGAEIVCQFCNTPYEFTGEELGKLAQLTKRA